MKYLYLCICFILTINLFGQRDCDEIIYVSPTGNANNPGTITAPTNMSNAVNLANTTNNHIRILDGTFGNLPSLNLTAAHSGVVIDGKYDINADFEWQKCSDLNTILNFEPAVTNNGASGQTYAFDLNVANDVRIKDLEINNNTTTNSTYANKGISMYGIHIANSSNFYFTRLDISTENASNGMSGTTGSAGASGSTGQGGSTGDEDGGNCGTNNRDGAGGKGGGGGGGLGGDSGVSDCDGGLGVVGMAAITVRSGGGGGSGGRGGSDGSPQNGGTGGRGGDGGGGASFSNGANGSTDNDCNPGNGAAAATASAGSSGIGYTPGNRPALTAANYVSFFLPGNAAARGADGEGGGGGGGGGGGASQNGFITCDDGGGCGGGGGGGGGEGGFGGNGGFGGGGAFGVYGYNTIGGTVDQSSIAQGNSGVGGTGGSGGSGGNGGLGAAGATNPETGNGGRGGNGGKGGNGGRGQDGSNGTSKDVQSAGSGTIALNTTPIPTGDICVVTYGGCTNSEIDLELTAGSWSGLDFIEDEQPGVTSYTSADLNVKAFYTATGHKDIGISTGTYKEFLYIGKSRTLPVISVSTLPLCPGDMMNLQLVNSNAPKADQNFEWVIYENTPANPIYNSSTASPGMVPLPATAVPNTTYLVRFRVQDACCGWSVPVYDSIQTIGQSQPPTMASATDACPGGTFVLTASGGVLTQGGSVEWFEGSCGGTPVPNPNAVPSPLVATDYFARYVDSCGTTTCVSVNVVPSVAPVAPSFASYTPFGPCPGVGTISLIAFGGSAGAGGVAVWYADSCGVGTPIADPTMVPTPIVNTTYFVRYEADCDTTACAMVTVMPAGSIAPTTLTISDPNACIGDMIVLTASGGMQGSGATIVFYQDSCGGTVIPNPSSVTVTGPATYYVRYEDNCGVTTCAMATLAGNTASTAPTALMISDTTACSGDTISLVGMGGSPGTGGTLVYYEGTCGGTVITDPTMVVVGTSTDYFVRYEDSCGVTTCAMASLGSGSGSSAPTTLMLSDTSACVGDTISLMAMGGVPGNGATLVYYQDSCGGTVIADPTTVVVTGAADYYVRYEDACGVTTCAMASLAGGSSSTAPTTLMLSDSTACAGDTIALTAMGGTPGTNATLVYYEGSCGGTMIADPTAVVVTGPTDYFVRYEDACGVTSCAMVSLSAASTSTAPTALMLSDSTACAGDTIALTAMGGTAGTNAILVYYEGSCGGTMIADPTAVVVSGPTDYFVRYEDDCGVTTCAMVSLAGASTSTAPTSLMVSDPMACAGDTIALTAMGGTAGTNATLVYYEGSCGGTMIADPTAVVVAGPTDYFVRYEDDCGVTTCAMVSFTGSISSTAPTTLMLSDSSACAGDTIALTGMGGTAGTNATLVYYEGSCGGTMIADPTAVVVTGPTDYFVRYEDDCGVTTCAMASVSCNAGLAIAASVQLEGPYDGSTMLMKDDLRVGNLIPLMEPYTALGYTHIGGGGESTVPVVFTTTGPDAIIDWVFVELRAASDNTTPVATRSALIQADGDIVDVDGATGVDFNATGIAPGMYWVVVRHRTHLDIMSATPVMIDGVNPATYDFIASGTFGNGLKTLGNGDMVMYEGDVNQDDVINASDRSTVWNARNQSGYLEPDSSLDGVCNAADRSQSWNNRNQLSQVP